jgi:hypothetical protein
VFNFDLGKSDQKNLILNYELLEAQIDSYQKSFAEGGHLELWSPDISQSVKILLIIEVFVSCFLLSLVMVTALNDNNAVILNLVN